MYSLNSLWISFQSPDISLYIIEVPGGLSLHCRVSTPTRELLSGWQQIEVQVIIYLNVYIQLSSKADYLSLKIID